MGGPAGTMEGGRQAEVAKAILGSLDVPYVVAAPLLIQDMESWTRDGIAGLQVGGRVAHARAHAAGWGFCLLWSCCLHRLRRCRACRLHNRLASLLLHLKRA